MKRENFKAEYSRVSWLFRFRIGYSQAKMAANTAIMYTLIETARFNEVDPEAWLADIIARIADHPISRLDELLPWKWERAAPQAIAA
jgi:hypothetical protein